MKYGMYLYDRDPLYNLGDGMQLIALEHIYEKMGVIKNDIVKISMYDCPSYDGEPLVMPVVSLMHETMGFIETENQFSDNIIPVYVSYARGLPLSENGAKYLKNFEPIGCRDAYTLNECLKHGLDAYYNGCITTSMPKRDELQTTNDKKVYIVDPHPGVLEFIPEKLKRDAVYVTHIEPNPVDGYDSLEASKALLNEYRKNASLVITRRVHCALPCAALGIPVIFAGEYATNVTAVKNVLPIYTPDEFKDIDWDCAPIDLIELKSRIISLASARIKNTFELNSSRAFINTFYSRPATTDSKPYVEYTAVMENLKKLKPNPDEAFDYAMFGAGNAVLTLQLRIKRQYPNATLTRIYDTYKAGQTVIGYTVEPVDAIKDHIDEFVIVTAHTHSVALEMSNILLEHGKSPDSYVYNKEGG